jgi:hypothetical protein
MNVLFRGEIKKYPTYGSQARSTDSIYIAGSSLRWVVALNEKPRHPLGGSSARLETIIKAHPHVNLE